MFEVFGAILAITLLVGIAFPNVVAPWHKPKKKTVGSTYWGVYHDASPTELSDEKRVEVPKAARKHTVVAGSMMYAGGKPTGNR